MLSSVTGRTKEAIDMEEQTKEKPKTNIKRLVVVLLLFFVITIIAGIVIPSIPTYRPETYCRRVESEAVEIKAALSDYFSNPAHNDINIKPEALADIEYIKNPWTLSVSGDNILIHVTDGSGKCPAEYQAQYPQWHSSTYTLKLFN
jgi:hypothetical protein